MSCVCVPRKAHAQIVGSFSQASCEGSGRFCSHRAWRVWREEGRRGETREPPAQPPSASGPAPQQVPRCGERRTSQPPLSSRLRDLTVLTEQKLAQREGGKREERGSREMATLTKYFLNRFLHFTRKEII